MSQPAAIQDAPRTLPMFDATVRCDRCGAQGHVITVYTTGELAWCSHHFTKHWPQLATGALVVDDRRTVAGGPRRS